MQLIHFSYYNKWTEVNNYKYKKHYFMFSKVHSNQLLNKFYATYDNKLV